MSTNNNEMKQKIKKYVNIKTGIATGRKARTRPERHI